MGEPVLGSLLAKAIVPIVNEIARRALTQPKGAGLTSEPVRLDARFTFSGPKKGLAGSDVRSLVSAIEGRLDSVLRVEYRGIPDNEVNAAVDAVVEALSSAVPIAANHVFDTNLDPEAFFDRICEMRPDLPRSREMIQRANDLYYSLLKLCCLQIVEFVSARPEFLQRSAVEQLRRSGRVEKSVENLRVAIVDSAEHHRVDFEKRYREALCRRLDRLQLFGVTLTKESTYPLSVAYMSLCAVPAHRASKLSNNRSNPEDAEPAYPEDRVESMISTRERIVIRGGAGSGKTTLLQWMAVCIAKGEFSDDIGKLATMVPFFIPLRRYVQKEEFPAPEDFAKSSIGPNVASEAPVGWVTDILRQGRGLVLVDGVDEVPEAMRAKARKWLSDLVGDFPDSRYVVTSRPPAVADDWLSNEEFEVFDLLPMSPSDVRMFIKHWHDAARAETSSEEAQIELTRYEESLSEVIVTQRQISRLATNPLLCALLCALYRDRRMQLPRDRMELYNAALEMLLTRRDTEREIASPSGVALSTTQSTRLLQKLAYWLISNGYSDTERESAISRIGEMIHNMPKVSDDPRIVYQHLLVRSGLIREPVDGRVDFVHRTFEEYLGAKEAVESENFGILVNNAHEDQWHGVFLMAVGHARPIEQQRLLMALLKRGDQENPIIRARLHLLAAACLEYIHELDLDVLAKVRSAASALIPPKRFGEAQLLATAGDMVLELLPTSTNLPARTAAAIVRTAALVGGPSALKIIARFKWDMRQAVRSELIASFPRFDMGEYASEVLSGLSWVEIPRLHIRTDNEAHALRHISQVRTVLLFGDVSIDAAGTLAGTRRLDIINNSTVSDLRFLDHYSNLTHFGVFGCSNLESIEGISEARSLRTLRIAGYRGGRHFVPDCGSSSVSVMTLAGLRIRDFRDFAEFTNVETVVLEDCILDQGLDGITSLSNLKKIVLQGQLAMIGNWTLDECIESEQKYGRLLHLNDSIFKDLADYEIKVGPFNIDPTRGLIEQLHLPSHIAERAKSERVPILMRNAMESVPAKITKTEDGFTRVVVVPDL